MTLPQDPNRISSARGWIVQPAFRAGANAERVLAVLDDIMRDPLAPGHSDVGTQNLLFTLCLCLRPERVLELGSHIGSATIIIAHALSINGYGHLWTVDPQEVYLRRLRQYLAQAELSEYVDIVTGRSDEPHVRSALGGESETFELMFIDACHDYGAVRDELCYYLGRLTDNGVMVLHDSSVASMGLDTTAQGGVRKAVLDVTEEDPSLRATFFEYPLWPNPCGVAMLVKQRLSERP